MVELDIRNAKLHARVLRDILRPAWPVGHGDDLVGHCRRLVVSVEEKLDIPQQLRREVKLPGHCIVFTVEPRIESPFRRGDGHRLVRVEFRLARERHRNHLVGSLCRHESICVRDILHKRAFRLFLILADAANLHIHRNDREVRRAGRGRREPVGVTRRRPDLQVLGAELRARGC